MSKKFNPLKSKGLRGKSPSARYPKSKGVQAVFSDGVEVEKEPAICEHGKVSYKNLCQITKRDYQIIDRLSWCLVMQEQKMEKQEKLIHALNNALKKLEAKNDVTEAKPIQMEFNFDEVKNDV